MEIPKKEFTPELSPSEKVILMRNTFIANKNSQNTVTNVSDYLSENFSKIDGFDYRWNSLITSNPLLFEDVDYLRCKQHVNNTATQEEIEAYKRGELTDLYVTFENMLMCNLKHYDRIMMFCTIAFLHYARINDDEITSQNLDKVHYTFDMTPTQIWCSALSNVNSTEWELEYAWGFKNHKVIRNFDEGKSLLECNWNNIYKNNLFAKFVEYSAFRCGTTGFRATILGDITSNRKMSQVCSKFTRASTAISQEQLITLNDYVTEAETINKKLYNAIHKCMKEMFNGDESQFAIYVYSKEFFIHSAKFSIKVSKSDTGKITKEYLANSYECFIAEEALFESIKAQIEWAKFIMPIQYQYDKNILTSLLTEMLKQDYREVVAIKRMNEFGVVSKITFTGIFGNVYINEELMFDNHCIRSNRVCYSKANAAKYVIERGYFIFGLEKDVYNMLEINRNTLTEHYTKYCIPVIQHMSSVVALHVMSRNDIIDVVCTGVLNPLRIENKSIKYTNLKHSNHKHIMNAMLQKQNKVHIGRKSYWKVIE